MIIHELQEITLMIQEKKTHIPIDPIPADFASATERVIRFKERPAAKQFDDAHNRRADVRPYDLFYMFTAEIIKMDVRFIR